MKTVNIHQAKTQLSRLVDEAARGEPFVIAKAGKPKVKVVRIDAPEGKAVHRIGCLKGAIKVPGDFDRMFAGEIEKMFRGEP